jgi:hypothetical protein
VGEVYMEFGGLVIEVLIIFGIPILIPILIILCAGKLSYNEKIKKVVLFIFSIIYNGIVGFISSMLFVCLTFLIGDIFNMKITLIIIFFIFAIILIPVNIYIMRKGKINPIIYIALNVIIFASSFISSIIVMRGSIDL